jgi:hemerythrin-like domain-containing protein
MKRLQLLCLAILLIITAVSSAEAAQKRTMQPIAPLMIEHRLVDRMIVVIDTERARMDRDKTVDPAFVDTIIDFIITYVDKTHHAKEEKLLFTAVATKNITAEQKNIMDELIREHRTAITIVDRLTDAKNRYQKGEQTAIQDINTALGEITTLYRKHVITEDKHFFLPVMKYFSKEEKDAMLQQMWDYDRTMIHVKYRDVIKNLETK